MTIKRSAAVLLAGAAATSIIMFASPANAGPVQVQSGCRFELLSVKANELQEDPRDEVYLAIGDNLTGVEHFTEGQRHLAADFGNFDQVTEFIPPGGRVPIQVFENDLSDDDKLGGFFVACVAGTFINDDDIINFGSDYDITYRVLALP